MTHLLGEEIFTIEEAAKFARVAPDKIREWCDNGMRHCQTANNDSRTGPRNVIVRKSVLLEYVAANEVGARVELPAGSDAKPKKAKPVRPGHVDPEKWVAGGRR